MAERVVNLGFGTAFTSGQTVTVSYAKPSANPLQDPSGNEVADFSGEPATNTVGDTTAPVLQSAVVGDATLTLNYDETLSEFSVPAASDFTVKVDGSEVSLADTGAVEIEGNGTTVALTLASGVTTGQTVTVSYTKGTNPIEDLAGNDAADFTDRTAGDANDTTAPSLDYAYVNGTHSLLLVFDEALDGDSVPAASAFTVSRDGTCRRCHRTPPTRSPYQYVMARTVVNLGFGTAVHQRADGDGELRQAGRQSPPGPVGERGVGLLRGAGHQHRRGHHGAGAAERGGGRCDADPELR